jgi:uncharacterized membrane protein YfcA
MVTKLTLLMGIVIVAVFIFFISTTESAVVLGEITLDKVMLVFVLAFVFEIIDSSLGQGYGTLGSPVFILLGFDPKLVVPSILISQAAGGLVGSWRQNYHKNVDFSSHKSPDMKKVYVITAAGIFGVIFAAWVGFKLPKDIMTTYIGLVVLVMGLLIVSGKRFKFSWKKLGVIGAVSAFNKGLSGGGYGPVVAGGQVIVGVDGKPAVGITNFAEAPICLAGFATWVLMQGMLPPYWMMMPMIVGSALAPLIGAWITYKLPENKLLKVLGVVIVILGILTLLKVLNP